MTPQYSTAVGEIDWNGLWTADTDFPAILTTMYRRIFVLMISAAIGALIFSVVLNLMHQQRAWNRNRFSATSKPEFIPWKRSNSTKMFRHQAALYNSSSSHGKSMGKAEQRDVDYSRNVEQKQQHSRRTGGFYQSPQQRDPNATNDMAANGLRNVAPGRISRVFETSIVQACNAAMTDVRKSEYETPWCHLVLVNSAFKSLLHNWFCRAKLKGLNKLLQSTVFVATEPSMLIELERLKLRHLMLWNTSAAHELRYDTQDYFSLMRKRLYLIRDLLRVNQPVFISEVDQVLFEDPLAAVDLAIRNLNVSFVSQDDSCQDQMLPCFGFMGMRPSPSLLAGWDRLIVQMDRRPQNEQFLFQKILRDPLSKINHIFLDKRKFWCGKRFGEHRGPIPLGTVMIHANWVVGVEAKVRRLTRHGLFSSTIC